MGSIAAISAFGSQVMQHRLQQSSQAKQLTAVEYAKKVRLGPVGKTEQELHFEKAKEMAENGQIEESLHAKVTVRPLRTLKRQTCTCFDQEEGRAVLRSMDVLSNPLESAGPANKRLPWMVLMQTNLTKM